MAFLGFTLFIVGIGVYFLPAIVAVARHHKNAMSILVVDLFLGWTLVGWVVALAWSCTAQDEREPA